MKHLIVFCRYVKPFRSSELRESGISAVSSPSILTAGLRLVYYKIKNTSVAVKVVLRHVYCLQYVPSSVLLFDMSVQVVSFLFGFQSTFEFRLSVRLSVVLSA